MKRLAIIISLGVILLVSYFVFFKEKNIWDENADLLKKEILTLSDNVKEIHLTNITPFDWEEVYFFYPYQSSAEVYEVIGYEWGYVSDYHSDNTMLIVFLDDNKVISHIFGSIDYQEYYINIPYSYSVPEQNYVRLVSSEDYIWKVKRDKEGRAILSLD